MRASRSPSCRHISDRTSMPTQSGGSSSSAGKCSPSHAPPRLIEFGRTSRVTRSALEAILKQVRDDGLPESISRHTMKRQLDVASSEMTPFGPVICIRSMADVNGGTFDLPLTNPLAFLSIAVQRKAFAKTFTEAMDRAPGGVMSLVI